MINERKLKITRLGLINIDQDLEKGKDYKIELTCTCQSEETELTDEGTEDKIFKLRFYTIDNIQGEKKIKVLKKKKSQQLRLEIEDLARLKGVEEDSIETYYESIMDSFIRSVNYQKKKYENKF